MTLPFYTVNAFDDILITVTKHADNRFHYQFSTPGEKPVVIHAFFATEELTTQQAFKRTYSDLAHWIGVTSGYNHLQRNDALRVVMRAGADLFDEKIFKDLKDATGSFDYNGIIVGWTRSTGALMDTTFETVVRDSRSQDMDAEDYRLGVAISSKVTITTRGNGDNLDPENQYAEYMKVFYYASATS
ncbi:hypothetical protein AH06_224 [Erwinia phage AH06]|nr:hypothetical protein AH06_224 [Erwinia phage AH06]